MLGTVINKKDLEDGIIKSKHQEFIMRLKDIGIDFNSSNLKELEKKISLVEKAIGGKKNIGFVDMHFTKDGEARPYLTEVNVRKLLDMYGYEATFDEIKKNIYFTDKDNKSIEFDKLSSLIEDKISIHDFYSKSFDVLNRKLSVVAHENRINPVKDFILDSYEKHKDNIDFDNSEIDRVFGSIKGRQEDRDMNYLLYKTWMISTISCQFNPDFCAQGVLTLAGDQGLGKGTWCRNLVPKQFQDKYYREEFRFNLLCKDNYIEAVSSWITELSEIGRSLKDIDSAKAFVTKRYDTFRPPYDRRPLKFKRNGVYIATVDKEEIYRDDANRRWWTIKVIGRFDIIDINYELLYAELYSLYLKNPKKCHELDWEGIQKLNDHNIQFAIDDDAESTIKNCFDWESNDRYYVPVTDIANIVNNPKINNYKIGAALKKQKVPYAVFNTKTKQKWYEIPIPRKIRKFERDAFIAQDYKKVIKQNEYTALERDGIKNENVSINK